MFASSRCYHAAAAAYAPCALRATLSAGTSSVSARQPPSSTRSPDLPSFHIADKTNATAGAAGTVSSCAALYPSGAFLRRNPPLLRASAAAASEATAAAAAAAAAEATETETAADHRSGNDADDGAAAAADPHARIVSANVAAFESLFAGSDIAARVAGAQEEQQQQQKGTEESGGAEEGESASSTAATTTTAGTKAARGRKATGRKAANAANASPKSRRKGGKAAAAASQQSPAAETAEGTGEAEAAAPAAASADADGLAEETDLKMQRETEHLHGAADEEEGGGDGDATAESAREYTSEQQQQQRPAEEEEEEGGDAPAAGGAHDKDVAAGQTSATESEKPREPRPAPSQAMNLQGSVYQGEVGALLVAKGREMGYTSPFWTSALSFSRSGLQLPPDALTTNKGEGEGEGAAAAAAGPRTTPHVTITVSGKALRLYNLEETTGLTRVAPAEATLADVQQHMAACDAPNLLPGPVRRARVTEDAAGACGSWAIPFRADRLYALDGSLISYHVVELLRDSGEFPRLREMQATLSLPPVFVELSELQAVGAEVLAAERMFGIPINRRAFFDRHGTAAASNSSNTRAAGGDDRHLHEGGGEGDDVEGGGSGPEEETRQQHRRRRWGRVPESTEARRRRAAGHGGAGFADYIQDRLYYHVGQTTLTATQLACVNYFHHSSSAVRFVSAAGKRYPPHFGFLMSLYCAEYGLPLCPGDKVVFITEERVAGLGGTVDKHTPRWPHLTLEAAAAARRAAARAGAGFTRPLNSTAEDDAGGSNANNNNNGNNDGDDGSDDPHELVAPPPLTILNATTGDLLSLYHCAQTTIEDVVRRKADSARAARRQYFDARSGSYGYGSHQRLQQHSDAPDSFAADE